MNGNMYAIHATRQQQMLTFAFFSVIRPPAERLLTEFLLLGVDDGTSTRC
jgi:hypothetical protein